MRVEGPMRTREYEFEGQKRKQVQLHVDDVMFLFPKSNGGGGQTADGRKVSDEVPF
ncbi:hypothetical protein D3C83_286350 [compost metagenome]